MKKAILTLLVFGVVGASVFAYYHYRQSEPKFSVTTAPVTRGDVVDTVGATGTLQAVTTVQVGTQVSGTILALNADFNSLVRKGQVLARLDPSLFQTQIEQARANLVRAQADLERLRVTADDAKTKLARARELSSRSLIPKSELDSAEVNVRSAEAQIRSSEAQVTQAQASLNQNVVNLEHTVIEAPIDGLVISRNVDVGQTVAASMQAPTLFVLAADLTKMQVIANLDESDVGRIRPGQVVSFRVDAYPADTFIGAVSQVRLEPKVAQNVVTYATVINVPNDQLKLKPGMTANVNIEIAKSSDVLRVPNSALRFRPTPEIFALLGQQPEAQAPRGDLAAGGRRGGTGNAASGEGAGMPAAPAIAPAPPGPTPKGATGPGATAAASPSAASSGRRQTQGSGSGRSGADGNAATADGSGGRGSGGGRGGFGGRGRGGSGNADAGGGGATDASGNDRAARMQNMSPEQRAQLLQRMQQRGDAGGSRRGAGAPPTGRGAPPAQPAAATRATGATTIDALFAPLPRVETVGRAWLYVDKKLTPLRLRLGISDGQSTELIEGDLEQGMELVTNVVTGAETRPAATAFPFGGGRGGFPGGGFPGGGGNRGGGGGGGRGR